MVLMQVELNKSAQAPWVQCVSQLWAWVTKHLPSPRFIGWALSCICFPTQAMTPEKVNMPLLTLPKLSPSPNDHHPVEITYISKK